jgi:hypothetical protein
MAIPAGHALAAAEAASLSLWGGTFASAARGTLGSEACASDATLALPVRAQSESLVVLLGGYVAPNSELTAAVAPVSAFISPAP